MRSGPVLLAMVLVLVALWMDGWDWWARNDVEVLGVVSRAPMVGRPVEEALGAARLRPKVSIMVDASFPPFASVEEDGRLVGFEVEVAEELGRRIAEQPKVLNMDGGTPALDALAARKIDAIIAGLNYTPAMARRFVFSDGYFEAGPLVIARVERGDLRDHRDLAGKRVAVEVSTVGEEEARRLQRELPKMQLMPMDEVGRILAAVQQGRADAAVLDRPSIPAGALADAHLRALGPPLRSVPYSVVALREERALAVAINRELAAMKKEGVLASMEERWLK